MRRRLPVQRPVDIEVGRFLFVAEVDRPGRQPLGRGELDNGVIGRIGGEGVLEILAARC